MLTVCAVRGDVFSLLLFCVRVIFMYCGVSVLRVVLCCDVLCFALF